MSIFDGLSLDISKIVDALKAEIAAVREHCLMTTVAAQQYKDMYTASQQQVTALQSQVSSLQTQLTAAQQTPAAVPDTIPVVALAPAAGQAVDGLHTDTQ